MDNFNENKIYKNMIEWTRKYFEENGPSCKAVIGISGGKDSTFVAKALTDALGKKRVIGILMPNGKQQDLDVALDVCKYLDIEYRVINIKPIYDNAVEQLKNSGIVQTNQMLVNIAPRIRMTILYAVAASMNGRVANTCNLSEDYVGYSTKFGDSAGDFSLLSKLTVTEIRRIGHCIGIPSRFINKIPSDGLCGKTDEDNLGLTYDKLDRYIRNQNVDDISEEEIEKIKHLHLHNLHKINPMPVFDI